MQDGGARLIRLVTTRPLRGRNFFEFAWPSGRCVWTQNLDGVGTGSVFFSFPHRPRHKKIECGVQINSLSYFVAPRGCGPPRQQGLWASPALHPPQSSGMDDEQKAALAVEEALRRSPLGSDFLISAFFAALRHYRRASGEPRNQLCLDCFPPRSALRTGPTLPPTSHPRPPSARLLTTTNPVATPFPNDILKSDGPDGKDFRGGVALLDALPHAAQLLRSDSRGCSALSLLPPQALQLLSWLLCHPARQRRFAAVSLQAAAQRLASVAPGFRWPAAPGHHQHPQQSLLPDYILLSETWWPDLRDAPAAVGADATLASSSGTAPAGNSQQGQQQHVLAFHGTCMENVHSIVHAGLQNMSGTHLQRTGSNYGGGIYLSYDLEVRSLAFLHKVPLLWWCLATHAPILLPRFPSLLLPWCAGGALGDCRQWTTRPSSAPPDSCRHARAARAVSKSSATASSRS